MKRSATREACELEKQKPTAAAEAAGPAYKLGGRAVLPLSVIALPFSAVACAPQIAVVIALK